MTARFISILLAGGAAAGFGSGLLGIGGGSIIVPLSYWIILATGVPSDVAIRIAFGTSLLVILPTATSGALGHNKRKAIHWKIALAFGMSGLLGALAGATLAAHLPGEILEMGFGALVLAIAVWMGLGLMPRLTKKGREPRENLTLAAACGFPVGVVTGLTGLGGGVLIVPTLVLALNFSMHIAVGTSVASIIFISLGGIVGYIVNGLGVPDLPPYSVGYLNLPVWLCLAVTSIPLAPLGARAAHILPAKPLRYIFIAYMVYVGLRMIEVF